MWRDLQYAIRSLRRSPAFAAAAVVTLALGIGANTAIFSLIEAVMLRTLPVRAAGELQFVAHVRGGETTTQSNFPWLERVQQRTDLFTGVTAYNIRNFKVASPDGIEQVVGQYVSGNYHALLGVQMALGRGFAAERDRDAGGSPYAVISHRYWTRRFARGTDVLGRTIVVGGHPVAIVGVTSPGFEGLSPGRVVDVTLPLSIRIQDDPEFTSWTDAWTNMPLVARLRPDVSRDAAEAALETTYREHMARPGIEFGMGRTVALRPAGRGADRLREDYGTALRVLMAIVGIVLLIACVNVANLLLVRGSARAREIAVRLAVGAGRRRLVRQLLTESCVLALAGGALGLVLAGWGTLFVTALLASGQDPVVIDAQPNLSVLFFATGLSILTGIAFGVAPAFTAAGIDLTAAVRENVAHAVRGMGGRRLMVASQLALSVVLLFGAVLLARTLQNLQSVDSGVGASNLLLFDLDAFDTPLPEDRLAPLCTRLAERLRGRSVVVDVSCSTMSPVDEGFDMMTVAVPSPPVPEQADVLLNRTTSDYFATFGIPLVSGRVFSETDTADAAPVAVVSEAFVRVYLPNQQALGQTLRLGRSSDRAITIVGVVKDVRQDLRSFAPRMVYRPLAQTPEARLLTVAVRTRDHPLTLAPGAREDVAALNRDVAVTAVRTMDEQIRAALVSERLLATLSTAFGVLAAALACIGLFGVLSYEVMRRRRDIGVRLALGSTRRAVVLWVLRQTALITVPGLAAGLIGAMIASGAVSRFLFGIEPRDPATLALTVSVLGVTAMVAGYVPAQRASRVNPSQILRAE